MKIIMGDVQDRLQATKRYGLKFDPKFKYCINSDVYDNDMMLQRAMKDFGLILKYVDG